MNEFREYTEDIKSIELEQKIRNIYDKHKDVVKKEEVEPALSDLYQIQLASDHFEKNIKIYSISIVIFIVLIVFAMFMIFTNMITKPLTRLQAMTEKVAKGDLSARAKESKYSPINKLIITFNRRISELEASRDKLIQAEKDMMWREMAQVMAHEIKNPLTPLRLSAERLEYKYSSKSKDFDKVFSDSLEIINEEIDNLQTLVKEFLKFARMPSANFTKYSLNDQINEIIKPYENQADIQINLQENMPIFYGDKIQMKQVFVNLIQNSIQAIDENGRISISTRYEDSKFMIIFEDNGEGIKDEDINKVFRPYFTTREKGTGLGLAIVKRIITQHNGTIDVESEKGKGTKFTITFLPNG
ncbi:MAG: ATP-binding protein [Candidatus Cloacimonetes bacterium]|nr:ATP-binding protein [Candidatus Cloacimonadota bacterium]MBL7085637.1 ATP-binding protein [Candidatus Cloacimonadota bacterium]